MVSDSTARNTVELVLGDVVTVGSRALIPIVRISAAVLSSFGWGEICPIAIVVVEGKETKVLLLTEEDISLEDLLERLPSLADKIEELNSLKTKKKPT
ncbi:MAG: hypothetical protein GTN80_04345 [Nitrososphaeria archaeon]|nr:hypothetical protein [Nitrososphaeria archaeon]NIN52370.1 hypothetical protein [Nitrososphaeria archaeon]NIQ32858.1 hypothetical protein [Nitrososphaeria archaeon]